jgi:hypothetical protein
MEEDSMKARFSLLLTAIWLVAVACGLGYLLVYDYTPGKSSVLTPQSWPGRTPHSPDRPTLVLFAHPKCPCTRASIDELARLMTQSQGLVDARVVFFHPAGTGEEWARTDLWQSAAAIPGVKVEADEDGRQARDFHATASGHVVLYDVRGRLLFSGGITESRGHSGDNAGQAAIVDILHHRPTNTHSTPTFGCALSSPSRAL